MIFERDTVSPTLHKTAGVRVSSLHFGLKWQRRTEPDWLCLLALPLFEVREFRHLANV